MTDFVLIRPLPFPGANRLVKVWERTPGYRMELSPANYRDWKRASTVFERIGSYHPLAANLMGVGEPLRVEGAAVDADLLPTLGVQPLIGRLFADSDDREGSAGTALLSFRLWHTRFGGDAQVVGRQVMLDNEPDTLVGVMPRDFSFPTSDAELWTPLRFTERNYVDRNDNWMEAVGRLRPGVTLQQARAEMDLLAARSKAQYPKENANVGAAVFRFADEVSEQSRLLLVALSGAAGCVMLIACANLANLLLVRALGRRRELAIRSALGAGKERMVRQLMTDIVDRDTASRSVQLRTIWAFAATAVFLAAIGIHGLLSFAISQRTQEIGIRMALGAQAGDVLGMVTRRSLALVAAGVVPGVALAYVAGRSMEALLAGVKPFDAPTVAAAVALSVLMTIAGSLLAARRALGVDPIVAIRAE